MFKSIKNLFGREKRLKRLNEFQKIFGSKKDNEDWFFIYVLNEGDIFRIEILNNEAEMEMVKDQIEKTGFFSRQPGMSQGTLGLNIPPTQVHAYVFCKGVIIRPHDLLQKQSMQQQGYAQKALLFNTGALQNTAKTCGSQQISKTATEVLMDLVQKRQL